MLAACLMLHQRWEWCQLSCRHMTDTVDPDCAGCAGVRSHPFPAPTHNCHSPDLQVKLVMAFQSWLMCLAGEDAEIGHMQPGIATKLFACKVLWQRSWKLECRQDAPNCMCCGRNREGAARDKDILSLGRCKAEHTSTIRRCCKPTFRP